MNHYFDFVELILQQAAANKRGIICIQLANACQLYTASAVAANGFLFCKPNHLSYCYGYDVVCTNGVCGPIRSKERNLKVLEIQKIENQKSIHLYK